MITNDVLAFLALILCALSLRRILRFYSTFRGTRVIDCPDGRQPAALELAAWHAAWTSVVRRPALRVRQCSRWRESGRCAQACLPRIAAAPKEFLVRTIVARWRAGKSCSWCGGPLDKPGLLSPDLKIFEWRDLRPETIPRALQTHAPVCRTCLIAETHIW